LHDLQMRIVAAENRGEDTGALRAELAGLGEERADWQRVADARREPDADLAAASNEAKATPEPPSIEPEKAPSAAEGAAAEADKLLADILPRLTDEERKVFEEALERLEADKAAHETIVREGAECLLAAFA